MIPAWISYRLLKRRLRHRSLKLVAAYVLPLTPVLVYSVYFGGFLIQFLVEKMGMMGAVPPPYGYFVQDIIVAAIIGLVTGWCLGPLIPVVSNWLAKSVVLKILIQFIVISLAVASQFFPYSETAPKRLILQHTFSTSENLVMESSYDFSVVDSNALSFVFKNSPEATKEIEMNAGFPIRRMSESDHFRWLALFPVSLLFSGSLKCSAKGDEILKHYENVPSMTWYARNAASATTYSRKIFMELNLGSLNEVWVTVFNITGPLSNWSFADYSLPASEVMNGGPPSYICRLSGKSDRNWSFWLEANTSAPLRVDVAVLDQYLTKSTKNLKGLFPSWVDVTVYSSFLSSYFV